VGEWLCISIIWSEVFETNSCTVGDGDLDVCLEKAERAESFAETPGRDKGLVAKGMVGAGGRGCDDGPFKGIAGILSRTQVNDSERGSCSI
jgi:hypothetical protein